MFLLKKGIKIFSSGTLATMATLATKKSIKSNTKNNQFVCNTCDYITNRYSHYQRHILTAKHLATQSNENSLDYSTENIVTKYDYVCKLCEKTYNDRSGLWRHKQKCQKQEPEKQEPEKQELEKQEPKKQNIDITKPIKLTTEMFYELLKSNNDLVQKNNELSQQIIELSSKPTTTNNNNTTNNFNLQFFLNETCKDALNIKDFVDQLEVGIADLEETGRIGYAAGISKIFINGLKQLDVNQRPVHCSDVKRETIYIKDKNQWAKDDDEKPKLTSAIRSVAHKNILQISNWTDEHPDYMDSRSKSSDRYMKIIGEAMPGSTQEETNKNHKKIARNITKETIIGK